MGRIFDGMLEFFREDDWRYSQIKDEPVLGMGFSGKNGTWNCFARAREEQEQLVFYSVCSVNAPENKRAAVAEYLTLANYGLIIGNFELDFRDGEIRYKTSIDVEDAELTQALIRNLVYTNVATMDRYLPGLLKVIYGGADPDEAIAELEH